MDDPREVLRAAGVESAEVDAWVENVFTGEFSELKTVPEAMSIIGPLGDAVVISNDAILALARLVAALAQGVRAERYIRASADLTTHRQTESHLEYERAFEQACKLLGLPLKSTDDDILDLPAAIRSFEPEWKEA